jgi:hypothetical protein
VDSKSFLSVITATIRDLQAARGTDSVDVAFLGNVLRRDGRDWTAHGFERLSVALANLQAEGAVEISKSEKGALRVAVRPGATVDATIPVRLPASVAPPATAPGRFRPLRPPVWFAFASAIPPGQQRQVNRRTGVVWSDGQQPPGSELDWVPVVPVPEDEQRRWANEFLTRPDVGDDKAALEDALQTPDWYRRFPLELEKRDPVLLRAWSHIRSTRIIDHVVAWANKNNVDEQLLFAAPRSVLARSVAQGGPRDARELRQSLLSAIEKMGTPELLDLPIPVRYVLEVVRPDLLQ